jgi:ketol-acid reductoisomerase
MELNTEDMKKEFIRVAKDRILGGEFAKEFMALDSEGPGVQSKLNELYHRAEESELAKGEARVRQRLGLKTI